MLQLERQLEIMNLLQKEEVIRIKTLSDKFRVSVNTIRRDLKHLASEGYLNITHGGAVINRDLKMGMTLNERQISFIAEKRRIGLKSAELIADGEAIILDAGTTTEQVAKAIKNRRGLTVITNAFNIAKELHDIPGITVVLTGGILNNITMSAAGFHAEQFVKQFHVAKAFISAGGVTLDDVTNTNGFEVQIKRNFMAVAEEVILTVNHQKIGREALVSFAKITDFDILITDNGISDEYAEKIRNKGVKVILC
ncbi:MAG: DeoR/GlpR transcriptional regulator [Spirochaetes bacterium]|nr:DeoR/GlpR transcriptional regulator [Spirochaetota bacterium]